MRGSFHGSSGWKTLHVGFCHKPLPVVLARGCSHGCFECTSRLPRQKPWLVIPCDLKWSKGYMLTFISPLPCFWNMWLWDLLCIEIIKPGLLSLGPFNSTRCSQNKLICTRHHPRLEVRVLLILWITDLRLVVSKNLFFFFVPLLIKAIEFTFHWDDEPK